MTGWWTADKIKELFALVGIEQCVTLAYSKEETAIIEGFNKEINGHLRALTFDNLSLGDYRKFLPFVRRILNSNHSDGLKISSYQMLFGSTLDCDAGIFQKYPFIISAEVHYLDYLSEHESKIC